MRKSKKLMSAVLAPCLVASLMAGCSSSSTGDESTAAETTKESSTEAESAETKPTETEADKEADATPEDIETTKEEPAGAEAGSGAAFVEMMKGVSDMTSYTATSKIVIKTDSEYEDGTTESQEIILMTESLTDGKGNLSVTISADMAIEDADLDISGELLTISKVDDRMYLDLTGIYDNIMDYLGDESEYIEQYAAAFDLTMDDVEELLVLGIPVGDLDLSKEQYDGMLDAMNLVYDDIAVMIDECGSDLYEADGNEYTFTVNNDNFIAVVEAAFDAFGGNIDEIYDAYVEGMKDVDYTDYLDTIISAVLEEVIDGIETAAGQEIDDETMDELCLEIESALEEYQEMMEEAIAELEDGKEDFIDEFDALVEEFEDNKADIEDELADAAKVEAVCKISLEGDAGERVYTCIFDATVVSSVSVDMDDVYLEDLDSLDDIEVVSNDCTTTVTISVETVIEEGDVSIKAPKNYAPLSKLAEVVYNIYLIYEEMSQGEPDYPDDPDYEFEVYTQKELAEIYGIKDLEDNQFIICPDLDSSCVVVTEVKGYEFYDSETTNSYIMLFDDNVDTSITVYVYSEDFDKDTVTYYEDDYVEISDDMILVKDETELDLYVFEDGVTVDLNFDAWYDEELYDEIVGDDEEKFMTDLYEKYIDVVLAK